MNLKTLEAKGSKPRGGPSHWLWMTAVVAGVFPALTSTSWADLRESFESAEPTWRLAEADCAASITGQQRTFRTAHAGSGCELVQVTADNGTRVYLSHDIPPAAIISELHVSIWIKADRPGVQLLARVVLPRTIDKRTGQPLTLLVRGTSYEQVGAWQQLRLASLETLLAAEVRVKRSELGWQIDERQAHIDKVVLNAYGGSRITNIFIDELEVVGLVSPSTIVHTVGGGISSSVTARPAAAIGITPPANERNAAAVLRQESIEIVGTRLLVGGRPFMPRGIEYHGEDFAWLKSLGFNVIVLNSAPSQKQMYDARALDLWLISPPGTGAAEPKRLTPDRLLAWNCAAATTSAAADGTGWLDTNRRGANAAARRPIVWNADAPLPVAGNAANVVLLQRCHPTKGPRGDASGVLPAPTLAATPGIPRWAWLDTDGAATESGSDVAILRRTSTAAIAAGARGFLFSCSTPLDGISPADRRRVAELQALNGELLLLEPWLAGGSGPEQLTSADLRWRVIALPSDRSRMLIAWRDVADRSQSRKSSGHPRLALIDTGSTGSTEAYQITPAGLRPLRRQRVTGGLRIEVESDADQVLVVCTQDALSLSFLTRRLEAARERVETASKNDPFRPAGFHGRLQF